MTPKPRLYVGRVFWEHRPPSPHPESPERLDAALGALKSTSVINYYDLVEPPRGSVELARRVHGEEYIQLVLRAAKSAPTWLDADTYVSPGTLDAATSYLASVVDAAERGGTSFILGRPPGHHAGRLGAAMGAPSLGFCIFNNAALAALTLADADYRVLVVDFDVHHGNGTQEILWEESRVYHLDLHEDPRVLYPGTGFPWQTGGGGAEGTKLNVVIPPGCGDDCYAAALEAGLNIVEELGFKPNAVVFSAGFDAYEGDGLAHERATGYFYYEVARVVLERFKPSVVVAVLEGGYSVGLEEGLPCFAAALASAPRPEVCPGEPVTRSGEELLGELESNVAALRRAVGLG